MAFDSVVTKRTKSRLYIRSSLVHSMTLGLPSYRYNFNNVTTCKAEQITLLVTNLSGDCKGDFAFIIMSDEVALCRFITMTDFLFSLLN